MIGRTLSHYRVTARIGAGGMGEVYRARDERLERDVALKVLPAKSLDDATARKRFRKEALALSKLNHPGIATIYDFDSVDGVDFLAMEFVVGETLAQKITGAALPEKEVLALGAQIADALDEAQEHAIVHRDLKPGNIMVTAKGRAKVLDFGLARLLQHATAPGAPETLSETQSASGTLPYMAPEQLRGESLDPRSDIFSLGAVLYEMSTGQRPFPDTVPARLTESIQHHAPVPPRARNPRLAPELERIILKCLEKSPELRYQSAKDLSVDLRRLGAPTSALSSRAPAVPKRNKRRLLILVCVLLAAVAVAGALMAFHSGGWRERLFSAGAPKIRSLAVLPLANLSKDPEQEYFVEGMADELITELAQISGLRVISRTSTMRYLRDPKPLPQIAKELDVDAVVEGSIERSGNQVRITAQLINARTDTHLWAHSYQRDLRDVLAMQSEVARAIAGEIQVQLTPQERERFDRSRPVNPAAHEAYLRGLYHWNFHTGEELQKAIAEYQRAIQIDPEYALAYVGLANVYNVLPFNGDAEPQTVFPKAREAAGKAVALDARLSEAHSALAIVLSRYDWDRAAAEREFKLAIALSPNDSWAPSLYAEMLSLQGRHAEAAAQTSRARELDPISGPVLLQYSRAFFYARQYERSVQAFQQSLEVNPQFWPLHLFLGEVYHEMGKYPEALAELRKAQGPTQEARAAIGRVYAISGQKAEAQKVLADLLLRAKNGYLPGAHIAGVYASLGDKNKAFEWLEKAYAARDSQLEFLGVQPFYDSLRSDPRFADLLRRIHLAP
jgi:serine/threonine protein kinase/tetratricopeptide (TPR) repeat protein